MAVCRRVSAGSVWRYVDVYQQKVYGGMYPCISRQCMVIYRRVSADSVCSPEDWIPYYT